MSLRLPICFFFGFVLLVIGGYLGRKQNAEEESPSPPIVSTATADRVESDAEEVFQRAFWQNASAEDVILHGERREWLKGQQVLEWEWFLAVEPSPELSKSLIEENRFRLQQALLSEVSHPNQPAWFKVPNGAVALAAEDESMVLAWSADENLLVGRGRGGGFSEGEPGRVTTPVKPLRQPAGRLPNHSPVLPQD